MTILCLGCSWTDKYHTDINPWPEVIQSKTNEKVINLGKDGSGNRYAYDQFLNYIRRNDPPSAVYWLMTEYDRIDCISKNDKNSFYTIKTLTQGKNKSMYLDKWEKRYLEIRPNVAQKELTIEKNRINKESQFASMISEIYDPRDFIDHNLFLIYMVQNICNKYNINLKIASALLPLQSMHVDDLEEKDLGWAILKSKYFNKISTKDILGWPFYRILGGMTGNQITNWAAEYGISPGDNHPNQKGSDLIASFFLGEKNIKDYK